MSPQRMQPRGLDYPRERRRPRCLLPVPVLAGLHRRIRSTRGQQRGAQASGMNQPNLFPELDPPAFDLKRGRELKDQGMQLARMGREKLFDWCVRWLEHYASGRADREACADDLYRHLEIMGIDLNIVGNAAGSLFKSDRWVQAGWMPSQRTSNHGRQIQRWRLKG
jgi:hypothetical protein